MALAFTACDEGTPPPVEPPPPPTPVGTISGSVTIEGTAAAGITATLSSGATTSTGAGGNFAFAGVEAGTYTVTISGFPEDATFAQVTQSATIASDGQNVQLNFAGEYIRSSAVVGSVVAADAMMSGGDGQPETLAGVTVTLGGEHAVGETMETDVNGGFAFTGLRAGTYTVTISDFPEDVSFEEVSLEISVEVGEVGQADFTGHFIRTSAVEGQVIIEGEGLAGVTVTLSGGPADESYTTMTDADGLYRFEDLRPGSYTVSISDFDTRDYEFAATSQDVSVDLDETGTVSFTGVLLRTSGIAGRVSVEGTGLGDITVTLAGADDRTAMTDAGGQYSFAGLAAGEYTVSIAVDSDAYVFEPMSSDVTLADDQSAIVNFEGLHARTASVSGMAFIDEATKNDMFDEGEHALAHAEIQVALVGPGVNEQRLGATDATGAFSFTDLRAGPYQLVVLINADVAAALAAKDVAYGGPGTGYEIALGVGEAASQAVPFDITHTTVNFTVSLRHGDDDGAALPGASVTLYADAAGETRVGGGETGDDGSVAIKVARAGTSGNTVHAGVAAEGYDVADGMTAVSWDPQVFATAAGNSNDIVNLNVDATVSGATITTDYGGGAALAGWTIGVTHGDGSVEGAPEMLDGDGNASLMTAVAKDDLPATFSFAVADDQDDKLDGGESYEGSAVEYTHTGLALAGTVDAGTIEAQYTTQTLKVYVHHEKDQVMGYTGNVLGGDMRDDGKVSVGIRYIDGSGRSRAFTKAMWDAAKNTSSKGGMHTFSKVPADRNVIAQAEKAADATGIKLLDPDELAAYTGMEVNGITGGAFGAMGGFSHTVELCPLQATTPQDHGECASFAYVTTHTVSGLVWKKGVKMSGDAFEEEDAVFVPGRTVSLTPVEGKNLAGEEESYTTAEKDTRKDKTKGLDATHQFSFGGVAAGVYKVSVPSGWRYRIGGRTSEAKDNGEFSPLAGDVELDVTPATATFYGRVIGSDDFPLDSVTVTVNGLSAITDAHGRYIVEGIAPETRKIDNTTHSNSIFVQASRQGYAVAALDPISFGTGSETKANKTTRQDIDLAGVQSRATISGTVRASGTNAPVAGVEITVDGVAPLNKATSGANKGKLVTGADGTYTAEIVAKPLGQTATVSASKMGMKFVPKSLVAPAHAGAEITGIDFTGFVNATITGRVAAPDGGPQSGVEVKAASVTDASVMVADTTGVTGSFSLSVPFGSYTLAVSLAKHTFEIPAAYRTVNVAPGQVVNVGLIQARTFAASDLKAMRNANDDGHYDGQLTVTWAAGTVPTGQAVNYQAQTKVGDAAWTNFGSAVAHTAASQQVTGAAPDDEGEFMVRIVATNDNGTSADNADDREIEGDPITVPAVDPAAAKLTKAARNTDNADRLNLEWTAKSNDDSRFQVVAEIEVNDQRTEWVVVPFDSGDQEGTIRSAEVSLLGGTWDNADGSGTTNVTAAMLAKAFNVAVESRQGGPDNAAGHSWMRSNVMSVPAKQ
jgi:hypothetical protein